MPKATCRCGAILEIPNDGSDRIVCPECSAKIRIRRDLPKSSDGDGFIRFDCPCGRRLKVREGPNAQQTGKCPDCGRVVPVPAATPFANLKPSHAPNEKPTDEMGSKERAAIENWSASHIARSNPPTTLDKAPNPFGGSSKAAAGQQQPSTMKIEAGLRVCTRCGRPLHLSAIACRECGAPAPKR